MTTELKPTLGKEMRRMREFGVSIPLASGRRVQMRGLKPHALLLAMDGAMDGVPSMYLEFITKLFWATNFAASTAVLDEFLQPRATQEETRDLIKSCQIVAKKSLIKPAVVDTLQTDDDDEEIALSDLSVGELLGIVYMAFQPDEVLYRIEANPTFAEEVQGVAVAGDATEDAPAE